MSQDDKAEAINSLAALEQRVGFMTHIKKVDHAFDAHLLTLTATLSLPGAPILFPEHAKTPPHQQFPHQQFPLTVITRLHSQKLNSLDCCIAFHKNGRQLISGGPGVRLMNLSL